MIQTKASLAKTEQASGQKPAEGFRAITHETNRLKKTKVYKVNSAILILNLKL